MQPFEKVSREGYLTLRTANKIGTSQPVLIIANVESCVNF
jgi:hypothetical protein